MRERGEGGSKAVWNFSENSSVLETPSVPKGFPKGVWGCPCFEKNSQTIP